ncbi:MAG: MarR family transcriptional regulator [Pseudomonadota bacterium]
MFHDIAHLIRLRMDEALKPYDLTRLKWLAMGIVADNEGLTQVRLAERLELKSAATGKLVDRLVARGLVERQPDPTDRRAHRLFATKKAENLLKDLEPLGDSIRESVLQGLNAEDVHGLTKTLQKIKTNLTSAFAGGITSFAATSDMSALTVISASL